MDWISAESRGGDHLVNEVLGAAQRLKPTIVFNLMEAFADPMFDGHALSSGEVDVVLDPPYQDIARLKADPRIALTQVPDIGQQYLTFDQARDELADSDVKGRNPFKINLVFFAQRLKKPRLRLSAIATIFRTMRTQV